ncbi:hypothetical protein ACFCX0_49425 [Streptomyces sp. NPDC056352]
MVVSDNVLGMMFLYLAKVLMERVRRENGRVRAKARTRRWDV